MIITNDILRNIYLSSYGIQHVIDLPRAISFTHQESLNRIFEKLIITKERNINFDKNSVCLSARYDYIC